MRHAILCKIFIKLIAIVSIWLHDTKSNYNWEIVLFRGIFSNIEPPFKTAKYDLPFESIWFSENQLDPVYNYLIVVLLGNIKDFLNRMQLIGMNKTILSWKEV